MNIYIQNTISSIIFLISTFLYAVLANATEYISHTTEIANNKTKIVEIIIDSDNHPHFSDEKRRCSYYWPYFEGKIKKPDGSILSKSNCLRYAGQLTLSKGYAPLGVFFRAKYSEPASVISSYHWRIRGPLINQSASLIAEFDSFNAAMVFETAGKYNVNLQVKFHDGTQADDNIIVTVWPRDGKTYYVDSDIGNDRFNGLSKIPDKNCISENKTINNCDGPWRSATRGFSVLTPYDWKDKVTENYGTESVCRTYEDKNVYSYLGNQYSLYQNSSAIQPEILKDKKGNNLKPFKTTICTQLTNLQKTKLKPGDQILFKRGQTFNLETGMFEMTDQQKDNENLKFRCSPLITVEHWSNNLGIHFSAYGNGKKPLIRNTGKSSCTIFNLRGVGVMHLSFQDLAFDLESPNSPHHDNRASLLFAIGQPINLVLNRISLKQFYMGALFHNAHGMFIKNSDFFDAKAGVLYSETATDVAFINNKFNYSGSHIAYTNIGHALITGNTFTQMAFGRTALRIFGSDKNHRTESIWISDNKFEGWIDPRTTNDCELSRRCQYANGKRYNWSLVELHPNVPNEDRFMENIVFKRNIIRNAETLLRIGATHNLLVENNIFDNADNYGEARLKLHSIFSRRPLKDVIIRNNLFLERSEHRAHKSPIIELAEYTNKNNNHKKIRIINNHFVNSDNCIVNLKNIKTKKEECLLSSSKNLTLMKKNSAPSYLKFLSNKIEKVNSRVVDKIIQKKSVYVSGVKRD